MGVGSHLPGCRAVFAFRQGRAGGSLWRRTCAQLCLLLPPEALQLFLVAAADTRLINSQVQSSRSVLQHRYHGSSRFLTCTQLQASSCLSCRSAVGGLCGGRPAHRHLHAAVCYKSGKAKGASDVKIRCGCAVQEIDYLSMIVESSDNTT